MAVDAARLPTAFRIRLRALGQLELTATSGDASAVLSQRKRVALLAYLALAGPRAPCGRESLATLFWPDSPADAARHSLREALRLLRRALGADLIVRRAGDDLGVDPSLMWTDVAEFERAIGAGRNDDALAIYRGPLLEGFTLREVSSEFEHWLDGERARLHSLAIRAASAITDDAERAGNVMLAARAARDCVRLAPFDEVLFRRLLVLLERAGDSAGALHAYEAFAERLARELEVAPSPETQSIASRLRAGTAGPTQPILAVPNAELAVVTPDPADAMVAVVANTPGAAPNGPSTTISQIELRDQLEKSPGARYATADAFVSDIEAVATPSGGTVSPVRPSGRRVFAVVAGIGVVAAAAWFGTAGIRAKRWALGVGMSEVKRLTEAEQYDSAWYIAERIRPVLPDDSTRNALFLAGYFQKAVLRSIPEGASVYRAPFGDTTHWSLVGTTPTDTVWLPRDIGHLRVERAGYRTQRGLLGWWDRTFVLDSISAPNAEMVHIAGGPIYANLVGLASLPPITIGDYFLDLHEVTNREYKAFVDAGGYTKRDWWPVQIEDGAKRLSWDDAVSRFLDKTGRPGPATWEAGSFPAGQADIPVSGVSWYEAAAYARFTGKSLPTIYHWAWAAGTFMSQFIVPGSNFESAAPRRGSRWSGMSWTGVFDMAGNVREWCENGAGGGQRYILGGGYSESGYAFTDDYAQPAMDRSAINGIRLAKYQGSDTALAIASRPQPRVFRDYAKERPVSDDALRGYLNEFDYDHTALNPRLVSRDTSAEEWIEERVAIDAAYGKERMEVVLLLPRHHSGLIQPVVFFPSSNGMYLQNSRDPRFQEARFVAKSGRAFVMPILKSTYERRDSLTSDWPDGSIFYRDHVVMWVKDIRRTLDYLSTRPDMDTTRFAYFGYSWGAVLAPLNLAADIRFKAAVLYVAGLLMERERPEVDPFNYLPRVRIPVLMLNGRYDFYFPVDVGQRPFFTNLGTPKDRKEWKIYERGHDVPRTDLMAETLKWLDKYLGQPR